ncbi:VCBS domain-containing protein [Pararhizobium sp. LjRoot235]|uniref:VCBS domain-containing protein n=1 Tax=Pararhizobium sp. LjRoot235 TaxID=3342291 RepID=UPI003F4FD394
MVDVSEDTSSPDLTATGSIAIADADQGQAAFQTTVAAAAGNLGSLVLQPDGSYTYSVANAAVQYLGADDSRVETFTVTALDGTSKVIAFTIHGANDAADIGEPTVVDVSEDTSSPDLTATGSIAIADADQGQAAFQTTVAAAAGNLGALTLASNGSYTYTVANAAVQYLGAGDSRVETFTVTALDGTSKVIAFTIHGANDAADIGEPTVVDVSEDTSSPDLTATGSIAIADADQGQAAFQTTVAAAAGNLGALTLASNGSYTYTVANAAVQYLGAGDSRVETFTVTALDGTSKVIAFTIHGANDAADIGEPTVVDVSEDTSSPDLTATGSIAIADADQGQAAFQTTVAAAAGNLGALTLASNGSYTYTVANAAVQYLGAGDSRVETFTVTALDGTSKVIAFTIHGANDAADIGEPTVVDVSEDTSSPDLTATGSIAIADADQGQAAFQTTVAAAAGNLGSLVLQPDGSYTYSVANAAVQYLGAGDSRVETFTVTALDGTSKQVAFTIHGANDAADIGEPTVVDVSEDTGVQSGNLVASGSIAIADADQGQAAFQTTVAAAAGNLGSLVLQPDGSYTYTVANAAVQYLGADDSRVETFTVTALDGTSKQVAFTIHGANDAADIGEPTVVDVSEDTSSPDLTATGSIAIADADQGQAAFQTTVAAAAGNLGSLVLQPDGSYTYTVANAAVQYLGADDSRVETFTVTALDGTSKQVAFTIHGANDAADIGEPTVVDVSEDTGVQSGNLVASGSIAIADADQGQAAFQTTVAAAAGNLGALTLASNGSYTYTVANAAVQYLGAGDSRVETFTVTALDGTSKVIAFTIHGANDAADIGEPTVVDVSEDTSSPDLTATGSIAIADADQGQAAFQTTVAAAAGNLGSLVLQPDGSYTYTVANAAVQYLGADDSRVETFTVTALDGTSKVIAFTIHGANDAADIGEPTVVDVSEDTSSPDLTATGSIAIADADQGQAAFQTTVAAAAGNLGALTLASNGSYTYTVANAAVQYLGAGDSRVETFTVTALDGTSKVIAFTIHGANDAADIGEPTVVDVSEDASSPDLTATGSIAIADADQGQAAFQTTVAATAGNLGSLVLQPDGSYTYSVANAAVQYLGADDSRVETFTVTALDGTSKVIAFTIHGANDAADIGEPTVVDVSEDASSPALTATGSIAIADADQGQAAFQTTVAAAAGNLGSLVLQPDGSYTYTVANAAVQYLGADDSRVETFTVTALDGTSKVIAFTIHGANDAADIGEPTVVDVSEDTSSPDLTATGSIAIADADQGQAAFQTTVAAAAGNLGSLVLQPDGSYTYSVANAAVQYLGADDSRVETFTVTALDGTSKVIAFTIHGANDAADIGEPTVVDVSEDTSSPDLTATGSIAIADADQGQAAFATTVAAAAGNLGSLVLQPNGSYTYSVANAAVQYLGADDSRVETFTVTALDGTSKVIAFTIHGANDAAVNTVPGSQTVGSNSATAIGGVSVADVDSSTVTTTLSVSNGKLTVGTGGGVTVSNNDTNTVTISGTLVQVNAALAALSYLSNANYSGADALTVVTSDGFLSDIDTVAITVNPPANAAPVANNDVIVISTGTSVFLSAAWLLNNDTDANGDALSISGASFGSLPSGWTVTPVNAGGVISGFNVSAGNPSQSVTLSYTISDGQGHYSTAEFTIQTPSTASTSGKNDIDLGSLTYNYSYIDGKDHNDTLTANLTLTGTQGNDVFVGSDGNDTLDAGAGNNILTGGAGSDAFVFRNFASTTNHVTDFDPGTNATTVDTLRFDVGTGAAEFSVGNNDAAFIFKTGNNAAINVAGTEVAVKTDASVTNATVQSTINSYGNINAGGFFVFHNLDLGHGAVYYDANPSAAGGAVIVAELDNTTLLGSLGNFNASDFLVFL